MPNTAVVEATKAIPNRGILELTVTIERDNVVLNLSGKTVTATVRREDEPDTVLNASLEDHAVVIVTALSGIVRLTLTNTELSFLTAPTVRSLTYKHLIFFKVVDDDYVPQPYRLFVHGVFD